MRWLRWASLGALVGALVASLLLNVVFFQRGMKYYEELSETRLDPLGMRYYPAQTFAPNATGEQTVVLFGDSRAQQWPAPPTDARWRFINRGIGGQTSAQVVRRFDTQVASLKPNVVLVQVGVNDLKTIPIFPQRKAEIIAQCEANIRQIVDQSLATGATVILTTIFPSGPIPSYRQPFWLPDVNESIRTVNDTIRALAGPNVIIFDTYELLQHDQLIQAPYAADELHVNAQGYEFLNQQLAVLLRTRLTS